MRLYMEARKSCSIAKQGMWSPTYTTKWEMSTTSQNILFFYYFVSWYCICPRNKFLLCIQPIQAVNTHTCGNWAHIPGAMVCYMLQCPGNSLGLGDLLKGNSAMDAKGRESTVRSLPPLTHFLAGPGPGNWTSDPSVTFRFATSLAMAGPMKRHVLHFCL